MKILVTGATGFLGRFLCPRLKQEGGEVWEVSTQNCDLTHPDALSQFHESFERIYHLAAWTQAGDFCLHHPGEQWIINQKINTNVLSWWQKEQPQAKLIAMGTSCSYGCTLPLTEENYLEGSPIDSLYSYAMTKRMLLIGLQALHKQFGLNYLYLVPSTLYGPGYHTDGRQLHFIFDLIRKIHRGKELGETVTLWGDGYQKRELIHVDDFLDALLFLSEQCQNRVVNIGAGKEETIRTFAHHLCTFFDYPFEKIVFDESKFVGARSKVLITKLLEELYPAFSRTPLEEGLAQTAEWFAKVHTPAQSASTYTSATAPD